MYKLAVIATIVYLALAQISACKQQSEVTEIFDVSKKVELVFFFHKDSSLKQQEYFHENILMEKRERGYWTREGVQAVFGLNIGGFEGRGIKFLPNATSEQRDDIKKRIKDSPIVYKVYENVVPNEINDL